MTIFLVRWLDEGTASALRDDGVGRYSVDDLASVGYVFLADSVETAKNLIADAMINDELLDAYDEDAQEFVEPPKEEMKWQDVPEQNDCYYYFWKEDIVAFAYIAATEIQTWPLAPENTTTSAA